MRRGTTHSSAKAKSTPMMSIRIFSETSGVQNITKQSWGQKGQSGRQAGVWRRPRGAREEASLPTSPHSAPVLLRPRLWACAGDPPAEGGARAGRGLAGPSELSRRVLQAVSSCERRRPRSVLGVLRLEPKSEQWPGSTCSDEQAQGPAARAPLPEPATMMLKLAAVRGLSRPSYGSKGSATCCALPGSRWARSS